MNFKKIKLALSVDLLNKKSDRNLPKTIKKLMDAFKDEVGSFLHQQIIAVNKSGDLVKESYALQFENCTLDLNVVVNQTTLNQYIYSFDFR